MIQPFIPPVVDGKPWQSYPTQVIASERRFLAFEPGAHWQWFFPATRATRHFVDPLQAVVNYAGH